MPKEALPYLLLTGRLLVQNIALVTRSLLSLKHVQDLLSLGILLDGGSTLGIELLRLTIAHMGSQITLGGEVQSTLRADELLIMSIALFQTQWLSETHTPCG